jgi:hypothetical protein
VRTIAKYAGASVVMLVMSCSSDGVISNQGPAASSSVTSGAGGAGTTSGPSTGASAGGSSGDSGGGAGSSTTGTGGVPDAGPSEDAPVTPVDSGADAPSSDPCKTALLCDNFDTYAVGAAPAGPWKTATNANGSVKVDQARAFSGAQSVKVATDNKAAYQRAFFYVENAPVFPTMGNVIYGRMMVWTDQAPMDGVHWTNIQGEGPASALGKSFTALYRFGGMSTQHLMGNYETSGVATDCWNSSKTATMPTGRWACMEWRFNGPNDEMNFWLDGQPVPDLTVVDKGQGCVSHDTMDHWFAPQFSRMNLGFESYQADSAPRTLWIDDVVLDTKPIGCPAPK